jgi:hypothetical protein
MLRLRKSKKQHFEGLTPNFFPISKNKDKNGEYLLFLVKGKAIKDKANKVSEWLAQ